MALTNDSLSDSIQVADGSVTILDDKIDIENQAAFKWLKAHRIHGFPHHNVVIASGPLSAGWEPLKKTFHDQAMAEQYLGRIPNTHTNLVTLQSLLQKLHASPGSVVTRDVAIKAIATCLVNGSAWLLEVPKSNVSSRWVSKTTPSALAGINTKYGTNVDFAFIARQEGNQWLRGYVPIKAGVVIGRSGMTVATGFDVGQWNSKDLTTMKFSDDLIKKLDPFTAPNHFKGMTKAQVVAKVTKLGPVPVLTKAEADFCDAVIFSRILGDSIQQWNRLKDDSTPVFAKLPSGWQTVWLSRNYQEGSSPASKSANDFRDHAVAAEWEAAIKSLLSYTEYKDRTQQEAALLKAQIPK